MLHYETVEPGTLAILKRLMGLDALKDFSLVGGTALALRYGHRLISTFSLKVSWIRNCFARR